MQIQTYSGAVKFVGVGERQVRFIASDATLDRQGDVLMPEGCDLKNFRANPILLWQHRADSPVARAVEISANARAVTGLAQFPPEGTDETSDRVYRMVKSGIINTMSVGFNPLASTPLGNGRGQKYTRWEMVECSFVSLPANPSAVITARAALSEQEEARLRFEELKRQIGSSDPDEVVRSRAKRLLEEMKQAGGW
jgi:HK97 family phage prohead protease